MNDLRIAFRSLLKAPAFSLVAVVILALGLGASTAIFSVVHALLLSPLSYPDSGQLVQIRSHHPEQGFSGVAPATFVSLAANNRVFSTLAAQNYYYVNVTGIDNPTLATSGEVTADYFKVFNVAPVLGRTWSPEETKPSAAPVVVLSQAFWRSELNSRHSIIGQQILLDDVAHTVIGVMPASFKEPYDTAQFWRPMRAGGDNLQDHDSRYWTVFGRLNPGATLEQAGAQLNLTTRQLQQAFPKSYRNWNLQAADLRSNVVSEYHGGLLVILGAVGCVMLITCANVAGLNIVRAAARRKELAIRTALGASRGRLIGQLLAESLVLAVLGGIAGVLLGSWGVDALLASVPAGWLPRSDEVALNLPVLACSLGLTLLTGVGFGLAPGFTAARVDANEALKDQARGSAGPAARRLRAGLVVTELALAVVLLIGAGLLGRSFLGLLGKKSGIDGRALAMTISLSNRHYDTTAKSWDFYSRAERETAAVPGVDSVGFTQTSPFRWGIPVVIVPVPAGHSVAPSDLPPAFYDSVSVDYFKTIGSPLLAGRLFTPADDVRAPQVVVLSEAAARRYFGAENPIGRSITAGVGTATTPPSRFEVVGVVGDVRRSGLAADVPLQVDRPLAQRPTAFATLMVRTAIPPASLAKSMEAAFRRIDPNLPVSDVVTMDTLISESVTQPRLYLTLFSLFAALALMLSGVGLYGLIAYSVAQRTREFGIRTALGASPRDVRLLVLREGALLIGGGLALGLAGAFAAARLLQAMIFETSVHDPIVFLAVPIVLATIAAFACWLPARRATRVDPMTALRAE